MVPMNLTDNGSQGEPSTSGEVAPMRPSLAFVLVARCAAGLADLSPWRNEDDEWFHLSALLMAVLLGALLLGIA